MTLKRKCEDPCNPSRLPRKLIDSIISSHIQLYNDNPTYQWTVLRHITSFHRAEIEAHFQNFWLPRLNLTVFPDPCSRLEFDYRLYDKEPNVGATVKFQKCPIQTQRPGFPVVRCRKHAADEMVTLIRLGEGILNEGYTGGGIVGDAPVPGLKEEEDGEFFSFEWKGMFENLFMEEMVMKRATDRLIEQYNAAQPLSTSTSDDDDDEMIARKQRLDLIHFLRIDVQFRRRAIVRHYRNQNQDRTQAPKHVSTAGSGHGISLNYANWSKFTQAQFLAFTHRSWTPTYSLNRGPPILSAVFRETSVVFLVPNWRTLGVRELARLRGEELRRNHSDSRGWYIVKVTLYSPEMLRGWIGRWVVNGKKKKKAEKCWQGKEVAEEVLEEELRIVDGRHVSWQESGRRFPDETQCQKEYVNFTLS